MATEPVLSQYVLGREAGQLLSQCVRGLEQLDNVADLGALLRVA